MGRCAVTACPAEKELVEQLACLKRGRQLECRRIAVGTVSNYAAALTPQAQVVDGAQGVAGLRVAALFSRVDEVQRHVTCDERDLGD